MAVRTAIGCGHVRLPKAERMPAKSPAGGGRTWGVLAQSGSLGHRSCATSPVCGRGRERAPVVVSPLPSAGEGGRGLQLLCHLSRLRERAGEGSSCCVTSPVCGRGRERAPVVVSPLPSAGEGGRGLQLLCH